jgi:plasmid stabilization system protein ParE
MRLIITDQASQSLENLVLFYVEERKIPKTKVNLLLSELLQRTRSLTEQPYIGQYEPFLEHLNKGYRRLLVRNVKIIYRVEADSVFVLDYFETHRDPETMQF